MRSILVVVNRELAKDSFEVTLAEDQKPVQTLSAHGADEAFGEGVGPW